MKQCPIKGEKPAAMQHANRSSIFDSSDSHGGGSNHNNHNNNNNNSIGAIGASTSSGMVPFAQNSLLLMLFSSLHLAYWQLCKLFDMSSTRKRQQKQDKEKKLQRKSSSSLGTVETCHCRQSSKHFQCCYVMPLKPPQKHQLQQKLKAAAVTTVENEKCTYNLHWVLNRIAVALIFYYHKIES